MCALPCTRAPRSVGRALTLLALFLACCMLRTSLGEGAKLRVIVTSAAWHCGAFWILHVPRSSWGVFERRMADATSAALSRSRLSWQQRGLQQGS